ncbi:serine/threonine-protein kinase [Roseateles sp. DAIF2]|uniref:leucine-rich repeat-containing protein kinase family protein n=1 Tax=Roseateles sp. DAIF2 TaxID=2714952 RepID=UPI0018A313AF|nr:leucine-rich repeat-containing protein kinase family protein [Roseateles sp. DAIF2]QPF75811.1 serine/threonine-protein kinase [Roseateles sp. DAIF2]
MSDHPSLAQLRSGALRGSTRLSLNGARLTALPPEIFDPEIADTLEILDVSGNALEQLPEVLAELPRLRIVFASNNRFTELPAVLGRCPQLEMVGFKSNRIREVDGEALPARLRWLILTDNAIETLPPELGRRPRLQKLALAGNRLTALPETMAHSHGLELLRISANRLEGLPDWLPALPRLAWLAFAGNPFAEARERDALAGTPVPTLPWPALHLRERLGEGASGVIHRAEHGGQALALKLFKGEVTSDGWPRSEMAAWLAAGAHPSLIPVTGRLGGHPTGSEGLVMPLVGPEFRALAGPPSLASCSRDVYAPETRVADAATLRRLAGGVAAAVAQLHARGISHGDLYAHNILHAPDGRAYLGDFGAASLFAPGTPQALALQRVEARAFGYLLEELIARCDDDAPLPDEITALMRACLVETPADRPLFAAIARALA